MAAFRGIMSRYLVRQNLRSNLNPIIHHPNHLISHRGITSKIFVGGISFHTTNEALTESFSQFGQVIEAKIITDRVSERSKGFGFVTFASEDEAEKAIAEMNGKVLNGRTVFVDTAKPTTHAENRMPIACGPPELNKQESFKRIPLGIDYL